MSQEKIGERTVTIVQGEATEKDVKELADALAFAITKGDAAGYLRRIAEAKKSKGQGERPETNQ